MGSTAEEMNGEESFIECIQKEKLLILLVLEKCEHTSKATTSLGKIEMHLEGMGYKN